MSSLSAPPEAPKIKRKLVLPPRRVVALLGLAALPLMSVSGGFSARDELSAKQGALTLHVRYPSRTMSFEDESVELTFSAQHACKRALVSGLSAYLRAFRDVRAVPASASALHLFEGPLEANRPVSVRVDGKPISLGAPQALITFDCDDIEGPRIALRTLVFP